MSRAPTAQDPFTFEELADNLTTLEYYSYLQTALNSYRKLLNIVVVANRKEAFVGIINIDQLITAIEKANNYFQSQVQKQVNTALTLRNWFIGQYLVEYEQKGEDRAIYGERLLKKIAIELKTLGLKSLGERNLYLCKEFYLAYPYILQTPSAKLYLTDSESLVILQTLSAKSVSKDEAKLLAHSE